ncbi:MAG: cyclic pyranopterin monophosphate synthase MoaC [Bacillota bacterium]
MELTHLDKTGETKMVDVSSKKDTERVAIVSGKISMKSETLDLITNNQIKKGNVLETAKIAGIMAGKKTSDLIPMCHPIFVSKIDIKFNILKKENEIQINAIAKTFGKTGVEMEAFSAATIAGLTIYDMCKAVDRKMKIGEYKLLKKTGGKSGEFISETLKGEIKNVCISEKKGVAKNKVDFIEVIKDFGIKDDAHAGKWHRQISLLANEEIDKMKKEGLELKPGAFGENIITKGLVLNELPVGSHIYIGKDVVLKVTQIGKKCHDKCAIYDKVGHCIMPKKGIFTKVVKGGKIKSGDLMEVKLNV